MLRDPPLRYLIERQCARESRALITAAHVRPHSYSNTHTGAKRLMLRSRSLADHSNLRRRCAPAQARVRTGYGRIAIAALTAIAMAVLLLSRELSAAPPSPAPATTASTTADPQVKTIHTREIEFNVPFRIDPPDPASRRAVEVQLHVSVNGGNWKVESTAAPEEKVLRFRAHGDGQYAFMVRTRDDQGNLQPATPPAPEMIVVVDTDPPVLELVAERGAPGEIRARWRSSDPHLVAKSMRVEYQLGSAGAWLPVAVDNPKTTSTSAAGEATWIVDAAAKKINIQAHVLDEAHNIAKTLRTIDLAAASAEKGADWRPLGTPRESSNDVVTNWPGERTNDTLLGSGPPAMSNSFPGIDGPRPGAYDRTQYAGHKRSSRGPVGEMVLPREATPTHEILPPPAPETQLAQPGAETVLPVPGGPDVFDPPGGPNERRQPAPQTRRELDVFDDGPRLSQASEGTEPVAPGEAVPSGPPVGFVPRPTAAKVNDPTEESSDHPRMVKSERFELDYDVEEIGRAGVAKVEVWGTKNGGKTWESYGVDADNRSPITVKVDGEGLYGFRIVIESGAGLRGDAPRPGDKPDVWVGVDTTKPMVRITGAEVGIGLQAGDMVIRWDAHDARLAERPISIYYSTKAGGPWVTIATGLENSGRFVWRLDTDAPERVYLRIAVRDEAGNVEQYDTPDPVGLDPIRPKGRIRSVRPADAAMLNRPRM